MSKLDFLNNLGLDKQNSGVSTGTEWLSGNGSLIESVSPADGSVIAHVRNANREDYETVISQAQDSFQEWRKIPAPQRGEIVRQIGNAVREAKADLGKLVSWEMGKIYLRRSSGNDRHLRFCGRPVASALRLHHAL